MSVVTPLQIGQMQERVSIKPQIQEKIEKNSKYGIYIHTKVQMTNIHSS